MGDVNISQLQICNSAILKVGGDMIVALTDNVKAAQILSAQYNVIRDKLLLQAKWKFSLVRAVLTVQGTAPAFGPLFSYPLPDDCLRATDAFDANPWTVEQGLLLCDNDTSVNLEYIQIQNGTEATWDTLFSEALAYALAKELALALVQSDTIFQEMGKEFDKIMALARSTNAVVGTPKRLIADFWTGARKYGFGNWRPVVDELNQPYGPI